MNFITEIKTLIKTYKILNNIARYNLFNNFKTNNLWWFAININKIKVVFSIAGLGHIFLIKNVFKKNLFILLIRFAVKFNKSILIFQNNESITHFKKLKILRKKTNYILTKGGVDLKIFKPKKTKNKNFTVLLASRMVWEKGINEFVQAYKILIKKRLNIKFILAGRVDPDSLAQ